MVFFNERDFRFSFFHSLTRRVFHELNNPIIKTFLGGSIANPTVIFRKRILFSLLLETSAAKNTHFLFAYPKFCKEAQNVFQGL